MKNQRKRRRIFKRLISGVSALALSVGLLGSIPASADDSNAGYKYILFAYSSEEGAITSSAANFCVNGNIATNGTISAGQNFNVNGEKKEHTNEAMPEISKAINEKFFAENVDVKAENYAKNETNIEVKVPTDVKGKAKLNGNIQLSAGLKAMGDIALSGNVLNKNSTVLFSENGNIVINTENANLTGLIYAPKGNIIIDSKNLNLNSVVMIANKITLNAPNININNNAEMAKFVQEAIDKNGSSGGNEDPEPVTDPAIYAYGEYNEETKSVDIEWYSNVTGEFAVLESMNGTDYTVVSKVFDNTKYSIKVTSDFIKKYFKVATIKDGKTIESIPFTIVNANGKYTTELLDTDKDGLADLYEEMLGTDKTVPDTDKDGLTDYEEVYITNTDPTKYDSVTDGVSDANADNDKDGLTNKREIELKTDPNSDDTDGDTLKDGDELSKYNTDPIKRDTDGDELEDDDELKFNFDPNKQDTDGNGIIDSKEKNQQSLEVVPDNKEQAVTKVSVSMSATGNIEKTTTVESIMNKDVLCSNVVGLVGEPFSIESESSFDKATITFTVDKTKLGETEFDNLMFLWYDRENDNFVELETSHNAVNSTVSIETTHFSDYMIVDSEKWWNNWREINNDIQKYSSGTPKTKSRATLLFVKCSKSSDPDFLNPEPNDTMMSRYTNYRTLISEYLISSIGKSDVMELVSTDLPSGIYGAPKGLYNQSGWEESLAAPNYCNNKKILRQRLNILLMYPDKTKILDDLFMSAADLIKQPYDDKRIVYITDHTDSSNYGDYYFGDVDGKDTEWILSAHKSIPVYFVCIGEFDRTNLEKIASQTGGKVYTVATLNELYSELNPSLIFPEAKDSDKDGFSDDEETYGLIVDSSGTRYKTDPKSKHSDNDGLEDNKEIEVSRVSVETKDDKGNTVWKCYHHMKSNPLKDDSDGDGINDNNDENPLKFDLEFMYSLKKMEKIVDEFKSSIKDSEESKLQHEEYVITKESPNYIITMNILRGLKYGSGQNGDVDCLEWQLTSGSSYNFIGDYINKKDSSILQFFYKTYYNESFLDPDKQTIDLLHMLATLSAYCYPKSFVKDNIELAGWGGDLQSMVENLKCETYGYTKSLKDEAYKLIAPDDNRIKTNFPLSDMLADIDAENMYRLYYKKGVNYLSEIFEDYYNTKEYYKKRYTIFIEGYNGIENLTNRAFDLTNDDGEEGVISYIFDVKYRKLHSYAQKAANDKKVKDIYLNGNLLNPIPLGDPAIVTREESNALAYAFIIFIRRHQEDEQ